MLPDMFIKNFPPCFPLTLESLMSRGVSDAQSVFGRFVEMTRQLLCFQDVDKRGRVNLSDFIHQMGNIVSSHHRIEQNPLGLFILPDSSGGC